MHLVTQGISCIPGIEWMKKLLDKYSKVCYVSVFDLQFQHVISPFMSPETLGPCHDITYIHSNSVLFYSVNFYYIEIDIGMRDGMFPILK